MKLHAQIATAILAISPVLAVPPANFGFPEAPDDTILAVAFSQRNISYTRVDPGILFGGQVANVTEPVVGLNLTASESLRTYNGSYLVMMVDPDASYPENPTNRFILHYLQPDMTIESADTPRFQDSNLLAALPDISRLINQTVPVASYNPPQPPTNSSAHRYILYAFQQPTGFQIPAAFSGLSDSNRTRFDLTEFISQADLGTPAAANYFYASRQSNVPEDFLAPAGGSYPGGNGAAVTSGDPSPAATSAATPSATTTTGSQGAGAKVTAMSGLVGAGLIGLTVLL